MRRKITIDRTELEQFYIVEDHSYSETCAHFGVKSGILDNMLREYGFKKTGRVAVKLDQIPEEVVRDLYITQNRSIQEVCAELKLTGSQLRVVLTKFNIRKEKQDTQEVIRRKLKERHGVESNWARKDVVDTRKKNFLEKHGVESPFQLPEILEETRKRNNSEEMKQRRAEGLRNRSEDQWKETWEKRDLTCKDLYGEEYQKVFADKSKDTYIKQYGVPYSVDGHEKAKQTCLGKYGTTTYVNSEEGKERVKLTKFKKYGGYFNQEKIREVKEEKYGDPHYNNRDKAKQTNQERYGVDWYCMSPECQEKLKNVKDSKPNLMFAALLEENSIDFEREFVIKNRIYDFKVGNTLIEINPYATHNSTWGIGGEDKKDPQYHQNKTRLAVENGYRCINVWDWDDKSKVIQQLLPKKNVYARKCKIVDIPQYEANRFCKLYHMQGGSKMQTDCYALIFEGEMLEVMTFGKPRFNKRYQWELIRLCTKTGYRVIGGADRLYRHFMSKKQPESLISYCDHSKFSGEVYIKLGMSVINPGVPSRHWYHPKLDKHLTDNGVRLRGFDLLVGSTFGAKFGKGTINDDLLREHGFVEIYDAGQGVYGWRRE